jgi:hypothetical protein
MTPYRVSKTELAPGIYSEAQDLPVHDFTRLFSELLEHEDPEELDEVFSEFLVPDPDLE